MTGAKSRTGRAGEPADIGEEQGVAIGRRLGDQITAQRAIGTRPVLDHDLLAQRFAHSHAKRARKDVGGAAGRVRHDNPDGTPGIGLRERRTAHRRGHSRSSGASDQAAAVRAIGWVVHGVSLV
jgi:hypothetical protein